MIVTNRLRVFPLTVAQLQLYLQANNLFEAAEGLANAGRVVAPTAKQRIEKTLLPAMQKAAPGHDIFHTFWLAVDQATLHIVAELGFKGPPDIRGAIEIGYGTMPGYHGRGYMTEAVGGMLAWATSRPDVHWVLAETDEKNVASIRVVQKNNFEQFNKRGKMLWWRKKVIASETRGVLTTTEQ